MKHVISTEAVQPLHGVVERPLYLAFPLYKSARAMAVPERLHGSGERHHV